LKKEFLLSRNGKYFISLTFHWNFLLHLRRKNIPDVQVARLQCAAALSDQYSLNHRVSLACFSSNVNRWQPKPVANENEDIVGLAEARDRRRHKGLFWKPPLDKEKFARSNKYRRGEGKHQGVVPPLEMGGVYQQDNKTQEKRLYCTPEWSSAVLFDLDYGTQQKIITTLRLRPTSKMEMQAYRQRDLSVLLEALTENQCCAVPFDPDFGIQQDIEATLTFHPTAKMKRPVYSQRDLAVRPETLPKNPCNTAPFDLDFGTRQNVKATLISRKTRTKNQ
jgi:hypothetical protein